MDTLEYAQQLIAFDSVSHKSNSDISQFVADHLHRLGFQVEWLPYVDLEGVTKVNIVGKRGPGVGGCAYLSHTDVVPADDWSYPHSHAFQASVQDGRLWGRGSCDMKGSLACALSAVERIRPDEQSSPLWIVCTADEEIGTIGAEQVNQQSRFFQEMVDGQAMGIVGEPTELQVVHAHKGGMRLLISSRGRSAHSSTSEGINANHGLIPILPLLLAIQNQCESDPSLQSKIFQPSSLSWNIVLRNEPEALNITPSLAQACVFFRTMPGIDHFPLLEMVEHEATRLGLEFQAMERTPALSVPTSNPCVMQMLEITGNSQPKTVCFATDGGVLSRLTNMVVCGPGSIAQAHCADEWISLDQLQAGTHVYETAMRRWSCSK